MKKIILILAILVTKVAISQTIQNDSFTPTPGKKYILSAWVKDNITTQETSYFGSIKITNIYSGGVRVFHFYPKGNIIDGWQLITEEFVLHENTVSLEIKLVSMSQGTSYFDDIRVFPYNGNLKSFVYDSLTQRLMSELDENNYATFYEYDKEGGLVRVKKETERGIYTIQETRSGNSKINN